MAVLINTDIEYKPGDVLDDDKWAGLSHPWTVIIIGAQNRFTNVLRVLTPSHLWNKWKSSLSFCLWQTLTMTTVTGGLVDLE